MKHCNGCNKDFQDPENHFHRALAKSSGYHSKCKSCIRIREREKGASKRRRNREKRIRIELAYKTVARKAARKAFGSSKDYDCAVLNCVAKAQALHHTSYEDALSVIPLCTKHHAQNHHLCGIEFEQLREKQRKSQSEKASSI